MTNTLSRSSIHECPAEADGRRFGDREMDLMVGKCQKGAIENTNKLVRQYIPKGTDIMRLTDEFIHSVQLRLNRRPRQRTGFRRSKDLFFNFLL